VALRLAVLPARRGVSALEAAAGAFADYLRRRHPEAVEVAVRLVGLCRGAAAAEAVRAGLCLAAGAAGGFLLAAPSDRLAAAVVAAVLWV
jgi:hypothetical protein